MLWSLWHLPLFISPGFYSAPFWIYTLIVVGPRLIIATVVNWSRFSIAVAIVMHASFNTVSHWLNGLFRDVQPQSSLPFELVLALGGLSLAAILIGGSRGRLGFNHVTAANAE